MKSIFYNKIHTALLVLCTIFCTTAVNAQDYFRVYYKGEVVKSFSASLVDSIAFSSSKRTIYLFDKDRTRLYSVNRNAVDSMVLDHIVDYTSYPALNVSSQYNDLTPSYDSQTQIYTITTTGYDPYIYTYSLDAGIPLDSCVLTFDYNCAAGINEFQIFFGPPTAEGYSAKVGSIASTIGTEWRTYSLNIKKYREEFDWGSKGDFLRLDFGNLSDVSLTLRHLHLRGLTEEEKREQQTLDSIEAAKKAMAANIEAYLATTYDSKITNVSVTKDSVEIVGTCSGDGTFALADIAPYEDVTETDSFENVTAIDDKEFTIRLERRIKRNTFTYDRALSKWAIVKIEGNTHTLASHARYADDVTPTYEAEAGVLKSKKGIAAGSGFTYYSDFETLPAHSITMNIVLNGFISTTYSSGMQSYTYGGRTYYINKSYISGLDAITKAAYQQGVIVSGILLTSSGSVFDDPENTGGYYTMPNMTTPTSVNVYAAALNYLAKRYSTGDYGRIHHWIMHNEVDMGDTWTNMGEQPEMRYYDRYMKSMRMCYNIVRQYDQHASILGSYTHNWNSGSNGYNPRLMLEQNVAYSEKEGDFRWGVAYHPYPIDLTQPNFWDNDKNNATFDNNTAYVTFYNPEVINAWILDKDHYYKDGTKRILFFSEQGTNSPDYTEESFQKQAAGAAWMWKKIKNLDGIDAMQWHAWADNKAEFGLRIGLRTFEEGDYESLTPKPSWYVWKAAGTDEEDEVFAPYLDVIGISDWDIVQTVK